MKPFHSEIGAVGFLEQAKVAGPVGVLIVVPKGRKLTTFRVTMGFVTEPRYRNDIMLTIIRKEEVKK